ncbi:MAG: glycosyltransferase family 1 protein [Dehalococcoidia bacterium]|jgi:glycosyltransferase involved in cell wall biosynthesis
MHIIVDASPLGEKPTGVQTYVLNILKLLASIDRTNNYTIQGTQFSKIELGIESNKFRIEKIPRPKILRLIWRLWHRIGFDVQLSLGKPDLFLSTDVALPLYCPSPAIAIVYDIIPLIVEGTYPWYARAIFEKYISHTVKNADAIVAISQSTRNDLIHRLGAKPEKIHVIYPGYDDSVFKPEVQPNKVKSTMRKFNIPHKYILYAGTLQTNKNIPRLIEAFALLKKERRLPHKLVMVGKKSFGHEAVSRAIDKFAIHDEVILAGYVQHEELPLLMNGADVFVFPSLHEGFGIPPLEAMACGTPVITSNASSLPEAVGDAGILVDPYNIQEIAEAMYRVISDSNLREQMRRKGLERARLFSWHKAAKEMLRLFEAFSR